MEKNRLNDLFQVEKPIIGMIHLSGRGRKEKITRALEELALYQEEKVNGVILEDYHGSEDDLYEILGQSSTGFKIKRGINFLRDPYKAFGLANDFGCEFIQLDSVQKEDLNLDEYGELKKRYPDIIVLGGVGFKYTRPTGNPLEQDLSEGKKRCDGIVTTGSGTGIETPLEKLIEYKRILGYFPLIVGAGVTLDNISSQLKIADGAIIGSYFKEDNNTNRPVDRKKVKALMDRVNNIRMKSNT